MKDYSFESKEQTAKDLLSMMFGLTEAEIQGFFKRTFQNMIQYWFRLDRRAALSWYYVDFKNLNLKFMEADSNSNDSNDIGLNGPE